MLGTQMNPRAFLDRVALELGRIDPSEISKLSELIYDCYTHGKFVFVIGNGGSGSNASHFCEDVGKGTLTRPISTTMPRKRSRSSASPTIRRTSWPGATMKVSTGYFVEQLKNLASPGDLLIAISGSGNSPNILRAVEWANEHGLKTFGCTGFSGGKLMRHWPSMVCTCRWMTWASSNRSI